MNKLIIALFMVATMASISSARIRPQSKLYFSIPLGPAPAAATKAPAATTKAPAATTAAADATTAAADATTAAADATTAAADATTAAADATTAAADATTAAAGDATTAAPAQMQLNIIPLGQLLGMLLTGLFGSTLPSQQAPPAGGAPGAQLQVVPLFQALGNLFG